jgi:hypothetical protein
LETPKIGEIGPKNIRLERRAERSFIIAKRAKAVQFNGKRCQQRSKAGMLRPAARSSGIDCKDSPASRKGDAMQNAMSANRKQCVYRGMQRASIIRRSCNREKHAHDLSSGF